MSQPSPSPSPITKSNPGNIKPKTKSGLMAKRLILSIWEPIDLLGKGLMGSLWKTVYLSIQDAISLSILLKLPSFIGLIIIGKDFSSYDVCLQENSLGVARYACFIIISSDFCLWMVLAGRIIGRFWVDIRGLKGKTTHGSN